MNANITEKQLKSQASILRRYLSEAGVAISHSQALEGLSRAHGWRNLATARAQFAPEAPVGHTEASMTGWVERLVFLGYAWADNIDHSESWYLYPADMGKEAAGDPLAFDFIRRLPPEHRFSPASSCVVDVYGEVPCIGKYELPGLVNRASAAQVLADYGLGVPADASALDVSCHDRGDDGHCSFWVTVRMPQALSDSLDALARKHFVETLAAGIREQAQDKGFAITRDTLADLAESECRACSLGEIASDREWHDLRIEFGF